MTPFPETLYVGNGYIEPSLEPREEIAADPRGLLLMWEPPRDECRYVIGFDATEGITGWTRHSRVEGDEKIDNCAIEILRPDARYIPAMRDGAPIVDPITGKPVMLGVDIQVAEWAGPCDAVEGSRIAHLLGRLYHGTDEDQCLLIWEAWPGVGLLATQELLRLGYANAWYWQYLDREVEDTDSPGWRSSLKSQRLLWYRSRRHLMNRQVDILSRHLGAEYANAEVDMEKMRARAAYGFHDDRFQAANMAYWASHTWTYEEDAPPERIRSAPIIDFQRFAPTLGDNPSFREWIEEEVASWYED